MEVLQNLLHQTAFANGTVDWRSYVMILVAFVFLYLAIKKGYEPLLLVPIAFGMLLVNIYPPIMESGGLLEYFFKVEYPAIPDFPRCRSDDGFWPVDCKPQELSSGSSGSVWYLCRLPDGDHDGL